MKELSSEKDVQNIISLYLEQTKAKAPTIPFDRLDVFLASKFIGCVSGVAKNSTHSSCGYGTTRFAQTVPPHFAVLARFLTHRHKAESVFN